MSIKNSRAMKKLRREKNKIKALNPSYTKKSIWVEIKNKYDIIKYRQVLTPIGKEML